ncbi:MAG: hypothetical protein ACRDCB_08380 [Clostridium sp.]
MELLKMLSNDFLNFPLINLDKEINFRTFIFEEFNKYDLLLQEIDVEDFKIVKNEVVKLINQLKKAIDEYYNGFPYNAYEEFEKGINKIENYLFIISDINSEERFIYYRARCLEENCKVDLKKEDMFHIPFNLRKFVRSYRYSINGFPCLYLGATPYTCWEELDRPNENKFLISRIKVSRKIRLLDLGIMPYHLNDLLCRQRFENKNEILKDNKTLLSAYLICIPLIMACSIKVNDKDAIFKEEYIIPQLLMQWIRKIKKFDGVKYFSTKTYTHSSINCNLYQNVAIPIKLNADKGYCKELTKKIKITDPILAKEALDNHLKIKSIEVKEKSNNRLLEEYDGIDYTKIEERNNGRIRKNDNAEIHYSASGFSVIEMKLYEKDTKEINNNY